MSKDEREQAVVKALLQREMGAPSLGKMTAALNTLTERWADTARCAQALVDACNAITTARADARKLLDDLGGELMSKERIELEFLAKLEPYSSRWIRSPVLFAIGVAIGVAIGRCLFLWMAG